MVYYADDGQILRIEMPFVEKMQTRANCASCGSSFVSGAATSGDNYMWGGTYGNNNFLWSDSSSVYGYGRFTNFRKFNLISHIRDHLSEKSPDNHLLSIVLLQNLKYLFHLLQ